MTQTAKKYHLITFGCQMNKSDSERIAAIMEQYQCQPVNQPDQADFIIMNTCSIRQSAEDRVITRAKHFQTFKKNNPELKIIITGCMAPRADAVQKATGVDLVLNIKDLALLPEKLGLSRSNQKQVVDYFSIAPKYTSSFQVYIPIMTGCNNFCTFCVVPYTRGREYSRPMLDVLKEVESAVNQGAKEIILLGQNVNSYAYGFEELLRKVNDIPGEFWVRFVSSNPQDMTLELIETVAQGEKLCNYIHFAVQAGNDRILKRMNRRHTIADYLKLYDYMKKLMPDVGISTDIIVGFPSETKEEFEDTVRLFERVGYDMAYIARYSARTNTPAWRLKDDVSDQEKMRREEVLTEVLKKTAKANGQKLVGKRKKVLVEKLGRRGCLLGKEEGFRTVNIQNSTDQSLIGQFVEVEIIEALDFGLAGNLV